MYLCLLSLPRPPAQGSFHTATSHLLHLFLSTRHLVTKPAVAHRCTRHLRRLHVESVVVRTATGPGGISGPLRIDLEGRYSYNVMGVRFAPPAGQCRHTHQQ